MNEWTIVKGLKLQITGDEIPLSVQRYTGSAEGERTYTPVCQFDVAGNLRLRGGLYVDAGEAL